MDVTHYLQQPWNTVYSHFEREEPEFVYLWNTKKPVSEAAFLEVLCDKLSDPRDWPYVFPLSYTDSLTFPRVEGSDSGMFYSSYWLHIPAKADREQRPEVWSVAEWERQSRRYLLFLCLLPRLPDTATRQLGDTHTIHSSPCRQPDWEILPCTERMKLPIYWGNFRQVWIAEAGLHPPKEVLLLSVSRNQEYIQEIEVWKGIISSLLHLFVYTNLTIFHTWKLRCFQMFSRASKAENVRFGTRRGAFFKITIWKRHFGTFSPIDVLPTYESLPDWTLHQASSQRNTVHWHSEDTLKYTDSDVQLWCLYIKSFIRWRTYVTLTLMPLCVRHNS